MAGIQLGGLASGFDTTSMVEQLMNAERTKVDRIYQQKMMVEYKQKAYTAIADKYADFVIKTRDIFGISNNISSSGLTRPSTMNSLSWVNKATSSNNNVSAKASSAAQKGTYDIEVTQLADNVKVGSQENINIDSTASLKEQGIHVNITINGKTIEDTDGTMTLNDLVSEMNKVDGISASYDKTNGRVFLSTNETGSSNSITITENSSTDEDGNTITSNVLSSLKLNHQLESGVEAKGKDAIINFNGAEGLTFSSNEFTIQGLELSVTDLGKTRVTVSTDIDGIVGKVTEFVDAYNSLIDDIAKTLTESKYNDYPPLTDDQKKDMTEKEIELWEEKTKSGLLRSDSLIQSIQTSMRSMVNMEIDLGDGKKIRLSDLGITTKSYFEGGQ
ncbi:MAG TPA: hypothetical protein DCY20_01510, partial [Firmicutes bacterium]|nr:hypothetical protein [Bacillota bacterium]